MQDGARYLFATHSQPKLKFLRSQFLTSDLHNVLPNPHSNSENKKN